MHEPCPDVPPWLWPGSYHSPRNPTLAAGWIGSKHAHGYTHVRLGRAVATLDQSLTFGMSQVR